MNPNWTYDTIKGKITITSLKAFYVEFRDGRNIWLPQSIVKNIDKVEMYNHDDEQVLEVPTWWLNKNEINGWF